MEPRLIEVKTGVLQTFDGEPHEVHGGVYLSPEAYLSTEAELLRLREKLLEESAAVIPALVLGGALLGLAAGFWLGRRGDDD
jgi:hypothetical protein